MPVSWSVIVREPGVESISWNILIISWLSLIIHLFWSRLVHLTRLGDILPDQTWIINKMPIWTSDIIAGLALTFGWDYGYNEYYSNHRTRRGGQRTRNSDNPAREDAQRLRIQLIHFAPLLSISTDLVWGWQSLVHQTWLDLGELKDNTDYQRTDSIAAIIVFTGVLGLFLSCLWVPFSIKVWKYSIQSRKDKTYGEVSGEA